MLKRLGYTVEAVSRKKADCSDYLKQLGAEAVLHPDEVAMEKKRPLAQAALRAAIVDPVGGPMAPDLLASCTTAVVWL